MYRRADGKKSELSKTQLAQVSVNTRTTSAQGAWLRQKLLILRNEEQNPVSDSEGAPPKTWCPSGYRTGPPACAKPRAKKQPGGGKQAGEKERVGAEKRKKFRAAVWHGKQEFQVARARVSRTGKISGFTTKTSRALGAMQRTLDVGGCRREIHASATCLLQFAKASAATLPIQEKNDTADVQRGRVNVSSFIYAVASYTSRR